MINLSISGNSIIFEFQDNQHYLNNGTIEVPVNSLTLVTDESNMATFKKSASNDIFLSCLYSELGMTKAELESFYKENMVGGGVDPADVLDIVESATSYYDGVEYDSVNSRINFKHNNVVEGYIDAAPFIVDGMVDNVAIVNGNLVITFNTDSGKQPISIPLTDIFDPNNYYNKTAIDTIISGVNDSIIEDEEVISSALNDLNERKLDASAYTPTDLTNYDTKAEVNTKISTATGLVNGALTAHTSDTTVHVTAAEKSTWNNKQDELISGTNIKTINNTSLLGSGNIDIQGGGGSYSAGTNISIDTGNTISCTLPIIVTTGYKSIRSDRASVYGDRNIAWGLNASVGALGSSYVPDDAFAFGGNVKVYNNYEAAFGRYNSSVQDTHSGGESGTTLFSVGNGAGNNSRHNAFEIRQNGDIYITKNGADVKLQDQLGGSASSAITSGDTNAVQGGVLYNKFDEIESVTAAALNNLNNKFGGLSLVKLTQAEYDALTTKDNNVLYVIVD